jgi:hypothetical protein
MFFSEKFFGGKEVMPGFCKQAMAASGSLKRKIRIATQPRSDDAFCG